MDGRTKRLRRKLHPRHEPVEPRIPAQGIESRVDAQPDHRPVARRERLLELREREIPLAEQRERTGHGVGRHVAIAGDRRQQIELGARLVRAARERQRAQIGRASYRERV